MGDWSMHAGPAPGLKGEATPFNHIVMPNTLTLPPGTSRRTAASLGYELPRDYVHAGLDWVRMGIL